ncbi:hypothetical protein [Streptomyces sp. NPDC058279]|uniref:hypothetical protein n=1 Tax=Streptomyces sp. NPDC058279 TaxID=3346418 RepID=UPI0036E08340
MRGQLREYEALALSSPPPPKLYVYAGAGISLLISIGALLAVAVSVDSYSMASWLYLGIGGLYLAAGIAILLLGLEQRRQYIAVLFNYGLELVTRVDHERRHPDSPVGDVLEIPDKLFSAGAYREATILTRELRAAGVQ